MALQAFLRVEEKVALFAEDEEAAVASFLLDGLSRGLNQESIWRVWNWVYEEVDATGAPLRSQRRYTTVGGHS